MDVTSAQFLLEPESSISTDCIRIDEEVNQGRDKSNHAQKEHDMSGMETMQTMQSMGSMPDMRSQGMQGMSEPVWVEATVDEAMPEDRIVRLTHADIDAWGMPGMTMNFAVAENVDLAKLEVGKTMQVSLKKPESGMFEVVGVKP